MWINLNESQVESKKLIYEVILHEETRRKAFFAPSLPM